MTAGCNKSNLIIHNMFYSTYLVSGFQKEFSAYY